jgi:NADP-dependent alcohol dehydrogenase
LRRKIMLNFIYHNPTKIVFGKGQISELDNLVPQDARVLVTLGGSSARKYGVLDLVREELGKSDRKIYEFAGIEANPQFDTLMRAVEIVRREGVDFILAVGGGSVMDGSKFIAVAAGADDYIGKEEELLGFGFTPVPVDEVVPLGTVVTLPATGSENNGFAVITRGTDKLPVFSPLTYPVFSILDPEFTFTLPQTQVANGVVDAFSHTLEQYMTYPVDARVQDRIAEGVMQTLIEIGGQTVEHPDDYNVRANLVWAATTALSGHLGSGVPQDWNTHMIGHELTALFGIDHAKTLAVMHPAVLKVRKEQKKQKLLQYAERVWGITKGDDNERIDRAIQETEKFFASLGMKTRLSEYGLTEQSIDQVVTNLEAHGMTALSEHGDVTLDISREMIHAAL